jgi:opacity protein-like surface antigen
MKLLMVSMAAALVGAAAPAWSQPSIKQQQVQFKKGESGATIKGSLKGEQIIDYKLRAGAGQVMVVQFKPSNPSAYFNVMSPGSDSAIFIGSTSGNEFSADLTTAGEYTIRVYLMRNAARRNESVNYTLDVGISGEEKNSGAATARVASNAGPAKWDASGSLKCSSGSATFDKQCGFRVVRDLPKKAADIWVGNAANGQADYRFLRYADKVFTCNDQSTLVWRRLDDNWWVSVDGKEFYLIPDALIHGG